MNALGRVSLTILAALGGFILAFLGGFYASFAFGANIHDVAPGLSGLVCGLVGAGAAATQTSKRLAHSKSR